LAEVSGTVRSGNFNIPNGAVLGQTGMRVILAESFVGDLTPTALFSWGEVEDHLVTIVTPAAPNDFKGTATNVVTASFPACSANNSANLAVATNSPETAAATNDVWYTFTATTSAVRVQLTGANDMRLELHDGVGQIAFEDDVIATGNETLIFSGLTPASQYWVAVIAVGAPSTSNLCISHLRASTCDNPTSFNSLCQNYKSVNTGANSYAVTFDDDGVSPFVATGTSVGGITTIQLGTFVGLPAPVVSTPYLVRVDATYNLLDAAGNPTPVTVNGTFGCTRTVNAHANVFLRASDATPNIRPANAIIGADSWWSFLLRVELLPSNQSW